MTTTLPWKEQRKNLHALVSKYPNLLTDALDAAYVAGLEDDQTQLSPEEEKEFYRKVLHSRLLCEDAGCDICNTLSTPAKEQ